MKKAIEVNNQEEFDACVRENNIAVVINCSVKAMDNASVVAMDNASVEAMNNVFIRLLSALSIKASAYVTVTKHGEARSLSGGRQFDVAP